MQDDLQPRSDVASAAHCLNRGNAVTIRRSLAASSWTAVNYAINQSNNSTIEKQSNQIEPNQIKSNNSKNDQTIIHNQTINQVIKWSNEQAIQQTNKQRAKKQSIIIFFLSYPDCGLACSTLVLAQVGASWAKSCVSSHATNVHINSLPPFLFLPLLLRRHVCITIYS